MKSKNATISLLLVLLVLAVALLKWRQEPRLKEAFDRSVQPISYTQEARCRMACLHLSEKAVKEIMKKGIINFNRSNRRGQPCPTFALQGRTSDSMYIQVLFAQCAEGTTILNCYNLEGSMDCPCPGEELKNR